MKRQLSKMKIKGGLGHCQNAVWETSTVEARRCCWRKYVHRPVDGMEDSQKSLEGQEGISEGVSIGASAKKMQW